MTVRHYKHTDASAPVLSGQAGALIGVLRACLVDGYGALDGAGWTVPYEDAPTNRIAFRQPAGLSNERYLWLDDTNPNGAVVRAYDIMSDIDTGTDQFTGADVRYWQKSSAADTTPRGWHLYTDDVAGSFWLFVQRSNAVEPPTDGGFSPYGFGDVAQFSFDAAVQRSWLITDSNQNSAVLTSPLIAVDLTLLSTKANGYLYPIQGIGSGPGTISLCASAMVRNGSVNIGRSSPFGGVASDVVGERIFVAGVDGITPSPLSGYLPGLHPPYALGDVTTSGGVVEGVGGKSFSKIVLSNRSSGFPASRGLWYVDLTGPWGA
jgi:hypothetical protein